jgi:predicted nucleic acid-binding protein
MNGRYLLDTNIVIRLFASDKAVLNWLRKAPEVYETFGHYWIF